VCVCEQSVPATSISVFLLRTLSYKILSVYCVRKLCWGLCNVSTNSKQSWASGLAGRGTVYSPLSGDHLHGDTTSFVGVAVAVCVCVWSSSILTARVYRTNRPPCSSNQHTCPETDLSSRLAVAL